MAYRFAVLNEDFYAIKLEKTQLQSLPEDALQNAAFISVFDNEYTLVTSNKKIIADIHTKFGPLNLIYTKEESPEDAVGVVAHISHLLSSANISILSFSSYARDAFLVPSSKTALALEALTKAGHSHFYEKSIRE